MAQADVDKLKQDLTRRMDGALETLQREFNGLRTGRAHPGLLEPVKVPPTARTRRSTRSAQSACRSRAC